MRRKAELLLCESQFPKKPYTVAGIDALAANLIAGVESQQSFAVAQLHGNE